MHKRRILGSSPQAQALQKLIEQAAAADSPVLITGERGSGREFVASLLHEAGRRTGAFERLSCAGLSEDTLFSGIARHIGDAGGTLLLDDIDELPASVQVELQRYTHTRQFKGVSGAVRLIASTSRPLDESVDSGRFDPELYRRLAAIRIVLAPLRDRKMDIPVLAGHFLAEFAAASKTPVRSIGATVLKRLMNYSWPGNVRELKDAVEHAAGVAHGAVLTNEDFAFLLSSAEERPLQFLIPGATIQEIEKEAILRTLEHTGGSTTAAARILNMSVRKIQYKLKQYRKGEESRTAERARAQSAGSS